MLFWVCLCLWSVPGSLFSCIASWICQLCWRCRGQLWWFCSCCCCLSCWCWCCWWLWPGWDGWICVPIGWVPRQGIGSGGGLFWCVRVPCPDGLVLKKLFLPYVLGYWTHFVWLWWGGCCPSEDIGLCVLVFYILKCWRLLSGCIVTSVSKKGNDPCCVGSTVNWMCGSWLLMCWSRSWLCSALLMTNVSSTNLSHWEGG